MQLSNATGWQQQLFTQVSPQLSGAALPWLQILRQANLARFLAHGFPTRHEENWKYTDISALAKTTFKLATPSSETAALAQYLANQQLIIPGSHCLVFVNGYYQLQLSQLTRLPKEVIALPLASAITQHPDLLKTYLSKIGNPKLHPFAALNLAWMSDGLFLYVPTKIKISNPVHLLFINTESAAGSMLHPHNLIIVDEQGSASLIEEYAATAPLSCFTNSVTELHLASGSQLEHYHYQHTSDMASHIGGVHVAQQRDSSFSSHHIALGGGLARQDLHVQLAAPGAQCNLNGFYLAAGEQHIDNHTRIDHREPHGTSREYYKGIACASGRAVFNGKVLVHPQAQRTDAEQINKNLLLSSAAEIDTKPELEIYADDVKCSHGATVGELDPTALFYLRSRGLPQAAAELLLTEAFAQEIIDRITLLPLRERITSHIKVKLAAAIAVPEDSAL